MVLSLRIKNLPVLWTVVLTQVDWAGDIMFIGATTSFLVGLTFGGTMYEWSSWRTMTPIVVGAVGLAGFYAYEYYIKAANPCVPPHVFSNRTSRAAFYMVVFSRHSRHEPGADGGRLLAFYVPAYPGSAVVGIILSKTGRYRPLHAVGFVLSTLGPGLNVLLDKDTIADAVGRSFLLPTLLPAVLASLPEKDVVSATGMYSFFRSFGYVWGITIPSIMFKNRFDVVSYQISDPAVRSALGGGRAPELSTGAFVQALPQPVKSQVLDAYLETPVDSRRSGTVPWRLGPQDSSQWRLKNMCH
ncbi:MFS general substrate transporter-like protein [Metarhizium guizhouense ARSEF 977]|uniref:MFS general substrate transporter-like protein n=1 Tax=Metarhizium guizhouense (strain ARSEF 977) TaxID=1276136 RepID=A0A0B4HPN3_METGA|nr:MFS general substrate transporter-like protein [Metarhizium guizhouense ARSEF 977]